MVKPGYQIGRLSSWDHADAIENVAAAMEDLPCIGNIGGRSYACMKVASLSGPTAEPPR